MAKKLVTLYIDDKSLRMLVTDGKRAKKWASLPLEPGLVKGSEVVNEAEVATKIKDLLKTLGVGTRKVTVGLSGLHSLTRPMTFPPMSKTKLAEAVLSEARKTLPVPLEQLYVTWQSSMTREKQTQVFMMAMPRRAVDALINTLRHAGLKLERLDLKPLALARLVREPTAIAVDVQESECDIIVLANGVPQPIRTIPLVEGDLPQKLAAIKNDICRTVDFYNSCNPEKPLGSAAPIYVSGELAGATELIQILSEWIGRPVAALSSPFAAKELSGMGPYLVNIGLLPERSSPFKFATYAPANLNALPEAYREKPPSLARVLALPAAATFIAFGVLVAMLLQISTQNIDSLRGQINVASASTAQRQSEEKQLINDIADLEKNVKSAEASYGNLVRVLNTFTLSAIRTNGDLKAIVDTLPGEAKLSYIGYITGGAITIRGYLPGQQEVLYYARTLENTGRFREVIIASMANVQDKKRGESVAFMLEAK